jgi:hypothetical protein
MVVLEGVLTLMKIINFLLDNDKNIAFAIGFTLISLLIIIGLRRILRSARQVANGKAIDFPSHPFFCEERQVWAIFRRIRTEMYIMEIFSSKEDAEKGKIVDQRFIHSAVSLPTGIRLVTVGPKVPNGFQIT